MKWNDVSRTAVLVVLRVLLVVLRVLLVVLRVLVVVLRVLRDNVSNIMIGSTEEKQRPL